MKYVTKLPKELESLEGIIKRCFGKRRKLESEREQTGISQSLVARGRSRVNSLAISLSKKQSVSSTMCALYMRRKSALYSSHEFVPLLLRKSIAIARSEENEANFEASGEGQFVRVTQSMDYTYRSVEMQALSMFEYISIRKLIKATEAKIQALRNERLAIEQ